jgi:hypothetical protein
MDAKKKIKSGINRIFYVKGTPEGVPFCYLSLIFLEKAGKTSYNIVKLILCFMSEKKAD